MYTAATLRLISESYTFISAFGFILSFFILTRMELQDQVLIILYKRTSSHYLYNHIHIIVLGRFS